MASFASVPAKGAPPRPPDKGSFPLDHFGECSAQKRSYMECLKQHAMQTQDCRELAKAYLQCRMDTCAAHPHVHARACTRVPTQSRTCAEAPAGTRTHPPPRASGPGSCADHQGASVVACQAAHGARRVREAGLPRRSGPNWHAAASGGGTALRTARACAQRLRRRSQRRGQEVKALFLCDTSPRICSLTPVERDAPAAAAAASRVLRHGGQRRDAGVGAVGY